MKCDFCGSNMSLEDERCPHCGQLNPHAQQHIKDMEHYQDEYNRTRRGVYSDLGQYKDTVVRIVIIAVLVIGIVVMWVISQEAYSIHRSVLERESRRKVEQYTALLDEYLEQENYIAFDQFCRDKMINTYEEYGYQQYVALEQITAQYSYISRDIMRILDDEDREYIQSNLNYLSDDIDVFYRACNPERYSHHEEVDTAQTQEAIDRMKENVLGMLMAYCSLTEEDAEGFENLSKAKRAALIEERMVDNE